MVQIIRVYLIPHAPFVFQQLLFLLLIHAHVVPLKRKGTHFALLGQFSDEVLETVDFLF